MAMACGAESTGSSTPSATPTATPTAAAVLTGTDPAGDVTPPEGDIVGVETYVGDDVLTVVVHAQQVDDPAPTELLWNLNVWPNGGTGDLGPAPFRVEVQPEWPLEDVFVRAYSPAPRRVIALWPGAVTADAASKTIVIRARIPGLRAETRVGVDSVTGTPRASLDGFPPLPVNVRLFPEDDRLGAPPITTAVAGGLKEITADGLPIAVTAPESWRGDAWTPTSSIQASAPTGNAGIGAFVRRSRQGENAAAALERLISETGGRYVVQPEDGSGLPTGFEAQMLVRTAEDLSVEGTDGSLLQNWSSQAGVVTRFAAVRKGDHVVVAFFESDGSAASREHEGLIGRVRLID
jgi:hypothetical protein